MKWKFGKTRSNNTDVLQNYETKYSISQLQYATKTAGGAERFRTKRAF